MDLDKIEKLIIQGDDNHPLKIAYMQKHRYYNDFIELLKVFKKNLSDKEFRELIHKFQFDKHYEPQKYFQIVSEIEVLYYILRKFNNKFLYEPQYNNGYNPECSFSWLDKQFNIEVKCPDYTNRIKLENEASLKVFFDDRVDTHKDIVSDISLFVTPRLGNTKYTKVSELYRLDNKLKDYLISAQKKFPVSSDTNFNILVISLEIISDLDEWYGYLFGTDGVFTDNSFLDEKYDTVDAILLTTPIVGHTNWQKYDTLNVWMLEETINLLFLDPSKQFSETGKFYFNYNHVLFGNLTGAFLDFLQNEDMKSSNNIPDISASENALLFNRLNYLDYRIDSFHIISKFINLLQSK